jgi:hypothetical protein
VLGSYALGDVQCPLHLRGVARVGPSIAIHSGFWYRSAFALLILRRFGVVMGDKYIQAQQHDLKMPVHLKKQHSLLGVISLVCAIIALATSVILIGMRPVDNWWLWNSALVIEPLANYIGIVCAILGGALRRNKKLFPIVGGTLNLLPAPVSFFAIALLFLIVSDYL